jgi:hypothetical protein
VEVEIHSKNVKNKSFILCNLRSKFAYFPHNPQMPPVEALCIAADGKDILSGGIYFTGNALVPSQQIAIASS